MWPFKGRPEEPPERCYRYNSLQWPVMLQQWPELSGLSWWNKCDQPEAFAAIYPDMPLEKLLRDRPERSRYATGNAARVTPMPYWFWLVQQTGELLIGDPMKSVNLGALLPELVAMHTEGVLTADLRLLRVSLAQWGYFHIRLYSNAENGLNRYLEERLARAPHRA